MLATLLKHVLIFSVKSKKLDSSGTLKEGYSCKVHCSIIYQAIFISTMNFLRLSSFQPKHYLLGYFFSTMNFLRLSSFQLKLTSFAVERSYFLKKWKINKIINRKSLLSEFCYNKTILSKIHFKKVQFQATFSC